LCALIDRETIQNLDFNGHTLEVEDEPEDNNLLGGIDLDSQPRCAGRGETEVEGKGEEKILGIIPPSVPFLPSSGKNHAHGLRSARNFSEEN
jgi:hypothetical protein